MRESITIFHGVNASAADHPFDDVAVVAKYSPWLASVVAVIGSRVFSLHQGSLTHSAQAILKIQQIRDDFRTHPRSVFSLALDTLCMLLRRDSAASFQTHRGIFISGQTVPPLFYFRAVAIFLGLIMTAVVGGSRNLSLPLNVGQPPSALLGFVVLPLLYSAVAFLHHVTPNFSGLHNAQAPP